jgi:hypothetical protein
MADRGDQDLAVKLVEADDRGELPDDDHSALVDVVQASDERGEE